MLERVEDEKGGGDEGTKTAALRKRNKRLKIQWSPINTATNGPPKIGRINGVAVLTTKGQL